MRGMIRMVMIFAISLAVAKIIAALLNSRPGKRLAKSTGTEALLTSEGRDVVQKYSGAATRLLLDTLMGRKAKRSGTRSGGRSDHTEWPARLDNTADLLSAGGTLARLAADFWRERMELEPR